MIAVGSGSVACNCLLEFVELKVQFSRENYLYHLDLGRLDPNCLSETVSVYFPPPLPEITEFLFVEKLVEG